MNEEFDSEKSEIEQEELIKKSEIFIDDSDSISSSSSYVSDDSELVEEIEWDLASHIQNKIHAN